MLKVLKQVDSFCGGQSESAQEVAEFFRGVASGCDRCVQLLNHPGDHPTHTFAEHRTATGIRLKPEDIAVQIEIARQSGLGGFTIFNLNQATIGEIPPALATGPTK